LALKQRSWRKGLILIADDTAQLTSYLQPQAESVQMRAKASWPGPTTWLWPAQAQVSPLLRGTYPTLAVRIPAHPAARALCRAFGHALVSTSANRSGQHPARSAFEVRRKLGAHTPILILHGGVNRRARPSQIIDLLSGQAVRS